MNISAAMAQSIVEETQRITNRNINFMDKTGRIIASIDKERIGDFHEGAWEALQTRREIVITEKDKKEGARPGVNLPVSLNNEIIGVIGITGSAEEVGQLGELIQRMTEILVKEAYLDEQMDLEYRAKESFIDEWLRGAQEDEKLFASRGWIMGINVHIPRIAAVMELLEFNSFVYQKLKSYQADVKGELEVQRLRHQIYQTIMQHFAGMPQNLVIPTGSSSYTFLLPIDPKKSYQELRNQLMYTLGAISRVISQKYGLKVAFGVGRTYGQNVRKSYKEARRAVKFTVSDTDREGILFYDQLGIESLMDELPPETRSDFIDRTLGPEVASDQTKAQLLETLRVFLETNQSVTTAAEKLFIHKNTLQYRLKKIRDMTGLDPRVFQDAVRLYTALVLSDIDKNKSGF